MAAGLGPHAGRLLRGARDRVPPVDGVPAALRGRPVPHQRPQAGARCPVRALHATRVRPAHVRLKRCLDARRPACTCRKRIAAVIRAMCREATFVHA